MVQLDPIFNALKKSNKSVVFRNLAVDFQPEVSVADIRKASITNEAQVTFGELGKYTKVDSNGNLVIESLEKPGKPIVWNNVFNDKVKPEDMFVILRNSGALTPAELAKIDLDFNVNLTKPNTALGNMSTDGLFFMRKRRTAESKANALKRYEEFKTKAGQDRLSSDMAKLSLQRTKLYIKTSVSLAVMLSGGFAALAAYAMKKNGCWLVDRETEERIVKVGADTEDMCKCGGVAPELQENLTLKENAATCDDACQRVENAGIQTNWANCQDSCFCMDKDGNTNAHQFRYEWVSMDAWDALGNLAAQYADGGLKSIGNIADQFGAGIETLLDGVQSAVSAAFGGIAGFVNFIKKWWWLPVVIVFVVVGAVLAIKYIPATRTRTSDNRVQGGGRLRPRPPRLHGNSSNGAAVASSISAFQPMPMPY